MDDKVMRKNEIKRTIASIGMGGMLGNAAFGIYDKIAYDGDCRVASLVVGTAAFVLTVGSLLLVKKSPYNQVSEDDYEDDFEEDYDEDMQSEIDENESKVKVKTK